MWRCVLSRCRTVTLTASRIPHPARGPRRVAVIAPVCRHPSCQRRRAASFLESGRVCEETHAGHGIQMRLKPIHKLDKTQFSVSLIFYLLEHY
jgi:hypothetical protein